MPTLVMTSIQGYNKIEFRDLLNFGFSECILNPLENERKKNCFNFYMLIIENDENNFNSFYFRLFQSYPESWIQVSVVKSLRGYMFQPVGRREYRNRI